MTRTGIRRGRRLGRGGHGKRRVFRLLSRPPGWMVFFFGCTYYFFFSFPRYLAIWIPKLHIPVAFRFSLLLLTFF